jgi:hypothetical protein
MALGNKTTSRKVIAGTTLGISISVSSIKILNPSVVGSGQKVKQAKARSSSKSH